MAPGPAGAVGRPPEDRAARGRDLQGGEVPGRGEAGRGVASSRIAGALREAILDGSYRPGERIRQEDVAARSGASRIPVREALRMLQAEGLVTLVANSGAWVTRLTPAGCAELYQIRERLEPLLLRASLPGLDGAVLGRLADLAEAMERSGGDVSAFLRADREFHLASYSAATPGETSQIIGRMWNTTQHYRREFTMLAAHQGGLGATHLEHRLLLDCLRRKDAEDAERVLVMHIRRTRLELSRHPEIFG
jgi:DNA-binding GntR family transcriptional regulator